MLAMRIPGNVQRYMALHIGYVLEFYLSHRSEISIQNRKQDVKGAVKIQLFILVLSEMYVK